MERMHCHIGCICLTFPGSYHLDKHIRKKTLGEMEKDEEDKRRVRYNYFKDKREAFAYIFRYET